MRFIKDVPFKLCLFLSKDSYSSSIWDISTQEVPLSRSHCTQPLCLHSLLQLMMSFHKCIQARNTGSSLTSFHYLETSNWPKSLAGSIYKYLLKATPISCYFLSKAALRCTGEILIFQFRVWISAVTHQQCELWEYAQPLWAAVSSSIQWRKVSTSHDYCEV